MLDAISRVIFSKLRAAGAGSPIPNMRTICTVWQNALMVADRLWHSIKAIRKLKPDSSVIEFQADLSGLEEITRRVLSWGSKARMLGPHPNSRTASERNCGRWFKPENELFSSRLTIVCSAVLHERLQLDCSRLPPRPTPSIRFTPMATTIRQPKKQFPNRSDRKIDRSSQGAFYEAVKLAPRVRFSKWTMPPCFKAYPAPCAIKIRRGNVRSWREAMSSGPVCRGDRSCQMHSTRR